MSFVSKFVEKARNGLKTVSSKLLEFVFRNSQKLILTAIAEGRLDLLEQYHTKYKYNFTFLNNDKETVLHVATQTGNCDVVS